MRVKQDRVLFRLLGLHIEAEGAPAKLVAVLGTLLVAGALALLSFGPSAAVEAIAKHVAIPQKLNDAGDPAVAEPAPKPTA